MKRFTAILGTLLIAAVIIISGSAVATWHYAMDIPDSNNVSSPLNILGYPNGTYASLGIDGPPPELGWIAIDLSAAYAMGPSQQFTVFANSSVSEIYNVSVSETLEDDYAYLGSGEDTRDHYFTTPSELGTEWRYIILRGWTGSSTPDPAYGPDIDAVGWDM